MNANKSPVTHEDLSRHGEAMIEAMEDQRQHPDGWHLDKKVPVTIILALLMQAAGGLWLIADMRKDLELLKAHSVSSVQGQRDRDDRQDRQQAEAMALVRVELQNIVAKLDRLIERGMK